VFFYQTERYSIFRLIQLSYIKIHFQILLVLEKRVSVLFNPIKFATIDFLELIVGVIKVCSSQKEKKGKWGNNQSTHTIYYFTKLLAIDGFTGET